MKFNMKALYFLLLFVNINNFSLSESINYVYDTGLDERDVYKNRFKMQQNILDVHQLNLFSDKFLENLSMTKLFVIIADDMQDGIALADSLSDGNRVKFNIEELSEFEVILQNDVMRNFYLFYSSSKEAHIFVYPRNAPNQLLAEYLTNLIIELTKDLKFALTCEINDNGRTVDSTFSLALDLLKFDIRKRRCELEYNIIFLPINRNVSSVCRQKLGNLIKYFNQEISHYEKNYQGNYDYFENRVYVERLSKINLLQALVIKPFIDDEDHVRNVCSKTLSILENDYLFLDEKELINVSVPLLSQSNKTQVYNIPNLLNVRRYFLKQAFDSDPTKYINSFKELNSPEIVKMFDPINIAEEFLILEKYYSNASDKSVLNFFYTEIKENLALLQNEKGENNDNHLLTSTINELIFKRSSQSESIVKIDDSLDQCIVKLEMINETKQEDFKKFARKYFVNEIVIAEKSLNNMKLEVENATINLNTNITSLLDELCPEEDDDLISDLKQKIVKLRSLKFSKFILLLLTIITSIHTLVDYEIHENLIDNVSSTDKVNYYEIKPPFAITKLVETSLKTFNDEIAEYLKFTETELNIVKVAENQSNVIENVANLYQNVYQQCSLKSNQPFHTKHCMITDLKNRESTYEKGNKDILFQELFDIVKKTRQVLEFSSHGIMNFYSKIYENKFLLYELEKMQVEKSNFFKIEDYETIMHDILQEITDNNGSRLILNGFANTFENNFESKKLLMNKFIELIQSKVKYAEKKFNDDTEIKSIIHIIKEGLYKGMYLRQLPTTFDSQITDEHYQKFVKIMLQSNMTIQDEKMLTIVTDIEEQAYYNDAVDYFKIFVLTLKCYIYPLSENIFFPDSSKSLNKSSVVELINDLRKLKTKLQTNKKLFEKVKYNDFGNNGLKPAFYTWENSFHHQEIVDLLDGKQVRLFSNISHAQHLNALKFRNIDVLLTYDDYDENYGDDDEEVNFRVNYVMNRSRILLIHNGDSYYRCLDKVQVIRTNTTSIFYSEKDSSYNDYILSPFATWTLQFYGISGDKDFKSLKKFANKLNIQLVGEGQYIDDDGVRNHCQTIDKK